VLLDLLEGVGADDSLANATLNSQLLGVELGAQLRQPEPHPALDGAGRESEPVRDLLVGEAVEEAELDYLALCQRKASEESCELLCFGVGDEVGGHVVWGDLVVELSRCLIASCGEESVSRKVDCSMTDDAH